MERIGQPNKATTTHARYELDPILSRQRLSNPDEAKLINKTV